MRIVSLVPSWTATLLTAGVSPVGRTRFCIHPKTSVDTISIVGGTKSVDWNKVKSINPDLVLMDKEENTLAMAEECPFPLLTTHVTDWLSMIDGLKLITAHLPDQPLNSLIARAEHLARCSRPAWNWQHPPGLLEWIQPPTRPYSSVSYVIWKKPWMVIQQNTFIADVLQRLGADVLTVDSTSPNKYPAVELEQLKESLVLFSSEPYPFAEKLPELRRLGIEGALVDGECYSWFGVKAIEFMESQLLELP